MDRNATGGVPLPALDEMLDATWEALLRGVRDRKHGFRNAVVSTVDPGGFPDARIVVLRDADRDTRALVFYTDARSGKLGQLEAGVAWTLYDARRRVSVRAWGPSKLADDATTEARWQASSVPSRKCYLIEPSPGSEVEEHTSGFSGHLDGPVIPTPGESEAGRENFAVVETRVERLEVLFVLREGHQRARFVWNGADWEGTWIVPLIREIIVVEGFHDVSAVRQAVDAELIQTNGFALSEETLVRIRRAREVHGVILLLDPDTAGEQIRRRIEEAVGPCKHAHLPRDLALKGGDIGVENALPAAILAALEGARATHTEPRAEFSVADLLRHGLEGDVGARARRERLGAALHVGYANARQLLRRLNHYGVTRDEFEAACAAL